jgi:hypothetical protein
VRRPTGCTTPNPKPNPDPNPNPNQGAAAYWLHHSLLQLQHALRDRLGTALVLRAAEDDG